jgi:glycosyltransferase involved in cell wall biosynthesis
MHVLEVNASEIWIRKEWSRLMFRGHAVAAERCALEWTDRMSVVSEGVRDQLRALQVADGRMVVAPNGVDPQEFRPDLDGRAVKARLGLSGKLVVGFVGTYTKWHGVETLRDAILADDPALRDVRFLLIGDGDLRSSMQRAIADRGLADRCTFTGFVPHAETPSYLAACDILVSPHLGFSGGKPFFGSPTKLFEYMAMGRPVVASAIGQIATILSDGENALLFEAGDVDGLLAAIKRLASDPLLRDRLGSVARHDVTAHYTWDKNLDRVLGDVN